MDYGGRHNTHNTSDCKRYNADGTPNEEFGSNFPKSDDSMGGKDKPYEKWRDDYQQLALWLQSLKSKADQEEADESHVAINVNIIAIITREVRKVGSGSDSK